MVTDALPRDLLLAFAALIAVLIVVGAWILLKREEIADAAISWLKSHELESRYIELDGERMHYVQAGRGPHLVFLHGIGASLFTWRHLLPVFAEDHTVTAIDLPGFGRSHKARRGDYGLDAQRDRVLRILDALGIPDATLVGSSMGGAIALWMACQSPERFKKVATLAPATDPKIVPIKSAQLLRLAPYAHRTINRRTMRWIYGRVVARPELVVPETIDAYLEPYLDEGISAQSFLAAARLLADRRMPDCFAATKSRVLIVGGERDRLVRVPSLRRLHRVIPDATLVLHPTAGHHMMEDEPEWTADALRRFLES